MSRKFGEICQNMDSNPTCLLKALDQFEKAVALLEQTLPVQPDTLASLVCTNTPAPESFASNLLSAPEKVL